MPTILGAELQADRFISADPANGILAAIDHAGAAVNIGTRDQAQGDVAWLAPAGSAVGGGTRTHRFDRPIVSTATITATQVNVGTRAVVGQAFGAVVGSALAGAVPTGSFGANYYNDGVSRIRPDGTKAGLMWEMDATDSVYLQAITAAGVATIPLRVTTAGLVTAAGGLAVTGGAFAAGTITKSATHGLQVGAVAGGTNDFALMNPAGSVFLARVPTGTTYVEFPNAVVFGSYLMSNDGSNANYRWTQRLDGNDLVWDSRGTGGSAFVRFGYSGTVTLGSANGNVTRTGLAGNKEIFSFHNDLGNRCFYLGTSGGKASEMLLGDSAGVSGVTLTGTGTGAFTGNVKIGGAVNHVAGGETFSATSGTPYDIFGLGDDEAYSVLVQLPGNQVGWCIAQKVSGFAAQVHSVYSSSGSLTITQSGNNVRVTQTTGATVTLRWSRLRLL